MKHNFLITFLLLICTLNVVASRFSFQHLNTSNGLPNQQVEAIVQDAEGYIWIGTRNGLAKFDGYNVQTYYYAENQEHSLIHNFVHGLFVDSRNRLWISTENGVSRYRPETDDFRNYANVTGYCTNFVETKDGRILTGYDRLYVLNESIDSFMVYPSVDYGLIASMATDAKGNIYVSTNKTLFSFNSNLSNITLLDPEIHSEAVLGHNVIMPLFVDSRQRLWVGRNNGSLLSMDLATGRRQHFNAAELTGGIVRTITEDKQHNIWIGTENGVAVIGSDGRIERIRKDEHKNSLNDNAIYSIFTDREDNVWIGSYFGGVDYMLSRKSLFRHFHPEESPGALNARIPRGMAEVDDGMLWIATEDRGVFIYDSKTGRFEPFNGIEGLGTNIHSLYYDKQRREVWIGTRFNGLFRYSLSTRKAVKYFYSHGISSEGIFYICQTYDGKMWVATMDGLRWYDHEKDEFRKIGDNKLDNIFVYSLYEDRDKRLWVATVTMGLFCIEKGRVKQYSKETGCGLTDNYVITVYEDSQRRLWIGTNNSGLFCLDGKAENKVNHASLEIPQQCTVCSIVEDNDKCLWIGTDNGLFRCMPDGKTRRFSANVELPVNQFNFTSSLLTSNGTILMGTFDGVIGINPKKFVDKPSELHIHFKKLFINNKLIGVASEDSPLKTSLDYAKKISLSYDEAHSFSIEYGVVMPSGVQSVRYQIRIDGIDKNWRDVGDECRFNGYLLQPGTYRLHVRANNGSMDWDKSSERVLTIVVEAPFYRSNIAWILYFLLLCAVAWGGFAFYNMRLKEKAEMRFVSMEKEKVKEVDKMKSNFFTMVSHELKTPLALVVAPLKTIEATKLDEEASNSLDLALRNAKKMEHLINELVTFNKIESDNFPFYVQQGNPVEFVATAASNFQEMVASKGQKLVISGIDNGEDGWFSPSYLDHILSNLMSNAMKFTPSGGTITIRAEIVQKADSPDLFLKMQVTDTGIGIVKEEQKKIFGRYYQTKRGFNAHSNGWGIGLALVSRLAEIHKGSVDVESELGKGSTFTVMIDVSGNAFNEKDKISPDNELQTVKDYLNTASLLQKEMAEPSSTGEHTDKTAVETKHTVMVVEDNPDMLKFVAEMLEADYNVVTATDGQEAWDIAIGRADIEMVVSDVMMPRMTGVELCNILKGNMATSHIPVILLTAKSDPEDIKDGYRNGADVYVPKPFDPVALRYQISNILRLVANRQKLMVEGGKEAEEAQGTLTQLDNNFVCRITELVERNIGNADFSVANITTEMGISRSLLHTKMKNLMNISTGDYIRRKRIEHACRMLVEGYNVSETAYGSGFSDPNYFSKVFKKMKGVAPTEFTANPQNKKV